MPVSRCSSELSSHKLQAKSKKSQAPSEAEGSAVRPSQAATSYRSATFPFVIPTEDIAK